MESGGRLIPWIPLVDAHGVDRAYTWDGVDAPWFVQVKTSGFTDAEGRHRWDLRVGSFAAYDRFVVVLALFDPTSNRIGDVFWRLDSSLIRKLARREYDSALRTDVYRLDASPTHQDRLAPYRHTRNELWKGFAPLGALTTPGKRSLPVLRLDLGGMFEFALFTELLRGNHKDLLLFRPAFDIKGRDLLVQLVGSSRAHFAQIKGNGHPLGERPNPLPCPSQYVRAGRRLHVRVRALGSPARRALRGVLAGPVDRAGSADGEPAGCGLPHRGRAPGPIPRSLGRIPAPRRGSGRRPSPSPP